MAPFNRRSVAIIIVVVAILSPLVTGRDSFPLSTYPMYASARADIGDLVSAVAVNADGDVARLSLAAIAATDDPLIAEAVLEQAIANGTSEALCRSIAARTPSADRIEIVTERHNLAAVARDGDTPPLQRTVHASCTAAP